MSETSLTVSPPVLEGYSFKTTPFSCQSEALALSADREMFALFMEQGTGKSKIIADNAGYLYNRGRIQGLVVFAPNGVHRNWIRNEIAAHLPDYIPRKCAWWSSNPTKAEKQALADLWAPGNFLRVFTVNYEAMALDRCFKEVQKFIKLIPCMVAVDESHRIKNPDSKVTNNILKLKKNAKYRRILTGTPVANGPLDIYSPFAFLDDNILRTQSFVVFRATYAEMMGADHPLLKHIHEKMKAKAKLAGQDPSKIRAPSMIATDKEGRPIYKNLDKLQALCAPHVYRALKKDHLDLPEKIFVRRTVDLHVEQRKWYIRLADHVKNGMMNIDDAKGAISKLTAVLYFQQILSGLIPPPLDMENKKAIFAKPEMNPRMRTMLGEIEGSAEQMIIWARFTFDILSIAEVLKEAYGENSVRVYYGQVSMADRSIIEDEFKRGEFRFFVGNQAAGGTGLTLNAATQTHYYSNSFKYIDRSQSEDRNHRIGQTHAVRYVDYEVENTVDTRILAALIAKHDVADAITGDDFSEWIRL